MSNTNRKYREIHVMISIIRFQCALIFLEIFFLSKTSAVSVLKIKTQ